MQRNSPAVQWLGLSAFTTGAQGSIPGSRTKFWPAAQCGQKIKQKRLLLFCLKARNKAPLTGDRVLSAQRWDQRNLQETLYPNASLPSYFFTISLPLAQTSLSCQFFTNVLFLCLKGRQDSCSSHFFGSSCPYEVSNAH